MPDLRARPRAFAVEKEGIVSLTYLDAARRMIEEDNETAASVAAPLDYHECLFAGCESPVYLDDRCKLHRDLARYCEARGQR